MTRHSRYKPPIRYTPEALDEARRADLLADAAHAEAQAESGPFYPDRGITAEALRAYARKCRADATGPR